MFTDRHIVREGNTKHVVEVNRLISHRIGGAVSWDFLLLSVKTISTDLALLSLTLFLCAQSAQDVAGRYHNICIIGVFDHPVTRGHRRQVWRVDDEADWANSGPLYDASSYALKT